MKVSRRERAPIDVVRGERVLAWAQSAEGPVGGTRDALYVPDARIPWEQVETAEWDTDFSVLRVSEVGSWGVARPVHVLTFDEPGRLLELVRERVSASIVLQRHVAIEGRRGVRVIARRAPHGDRPLSWLYEYDEGIDPDDALVRQAAGEALAAARDEVGEV
ncbi:hypothetical protein [Nocardioides sp.]|uniref:hypothetical protein n=1 Tax=Nocardioides sp. TaxID=35761 RepID=UPI0031FF0F54|nr:hypothetical protein [Nocardioides sp.]